MGYDIQIWFVGTFNNFECNPSQPGLAFFKFWNNVATSSGVTELMNIDAIFVSLIKLVGSVSLFGILSARDFPTFM